MKFENENNWNIKINTYAIIGDLSEEQVKDVLNSYDTDFYRRWLELYKKKDHNFVDSPLGLWQLKKGRLIEKQFHNSIEYIFEDGKVKCSVDLDIMFPESFDQGDVGHWVEGFLRINKVHVCVQMDELTENHKIPNRRENTLTSELEYNQEWAIILKNKI